MALVRELGIVGLGKFGLSLAETYVELGHRVLAVDKNEARIKQAQEFLSQVYKADGTDKRALQQLGFGDMEYVLVSIGQSMEASILVVLNLQEMKVPNIWVKAISADHEKVLNKLGADLVVFPERHVAKQLAHRLAVPGLLNYLSLGRGAILQEVTVNKWADQTLRDLDLTNTAGVQIVAIRRLGDKDYTFLLKADDVLRNGDMCVVIGSEESVAKLHA